MKPFHLDACSHDRPRDRFLGTIEDEVRGQLDVYVYQDNALSAPVPDMNVCIRYGEEGSQYLSPGNVDEFVKRIRTTKPTEFPSGRVVEWPRYYVLAVDLIEKWINEGRR